MQTYYALISVDAIFLIIETKSSFNNSNVETLIYGDSKTGGGWHLTVSVLVFSFIVAVVAIVVAVVSNKGYCSFNKMVTRN